MQRTVGSVAGDLDRVGDRLDRRAAPRVAVVLVVPADRRGRCPALQCVTVNVVSSRLLPGAVSTRGPEDVCGLVLGDRQRAGLELVDGDLGAQRGAQGGRVGRALDEDVQGRHDRVAVGDDRVAGAVEQLADRLRVDVDRLHAQHVVAAAADADARACCGRTRTARSRRWRGRCCDSAAGARPRGAGGSTRARPRRRRRAAAAQRSPGRSPRAARARRWSGAGPRSGRTRPPSSTTRRSSRTCRSR